MTLKRLSKKDMEKILAGWIFYLEGADNMDAGDPQLLRQDLINIKWSLGFADDPSPSLP